MVTARKGSLATRSTKTTSGPSTISVPKTTKVSSSKFNKHQGK